MERATQKWLVVNRNIPLFSKKMALRHSGESQKMCRKVAGASTGYVCAAHEGRCVICDAFSDASKPVKICDDCGFQRKSLHSQVAAADAAAAAVAEDANNKHVAISHRRCIVCNRDGATDIAFYCRSCVLLEKDRDGCPVVLNLGGHQAMRSIIAKSSASSSAGGAISSS
jgi:PHD finger-like domain-containing protein 5A